MPVTTFDKLQAAYPREKKEQLFARLGGEWPKLVNDKAYVNTCAIRLSVALWGAGVPIPARFKEAIDGQGRPFVVKVKTMGEFVNEVFGTPWGMSKIEGTPIRVPSFKGIIVYHVAWDNATGHFDLWSGKEFVGSGNLDDVAAGYNIALWSVA